VIRAWTLKQRLVAIVIAAVGLGVMFMIQLNAPGASLPPTSSTPGQPAGVVPQPGQSVTWSRVASPFALGDPVPIRVDRLAGSGDGLLGWGRVLAPNVNQFNDFGAAFLSPDGEHWRAIAIHDGVAATDTSEIHGVASGPSGYLAFGGVCCEEEAQAAWTSEDGQRWSRVVLAGDFDPRADWFANVVGVETGWVGVGMSANRGAIWTSPDGATWNAVAVEFGVGVINDVAVFDDGVVAVGTVDDAAGTHDGAIYVNEAGGWKRVAEVDPTLTGPEEVELWSIRSFGRGLFLQGSLGLHADRVKCEELLGAVASPRDSPPQIGLSCGWGTDHHWLTDDPTAWQRIQIGPRFGQQAAPGARPLEFSKLSALRAGLVNLAEDTLPPDGDSNVWVSEDGRGWRPIQSLGEPLVAGFAAFATLNDRFIVVDASGQLDDGRPGVGILVGILR
jgi:hypothetical protein